MLALLARHRAALVLVDIAYMPHPAELAQRLDLVTTDFVYARLIGDRKAVEAKTKSFDRVVIDLFCTNTRRRALWHGLELVGRVAGLRRRGGGGDEGRRARAFRGPRRRVGSAGATGRARRTSGRPRLEGR